MKEKGLAPLVIILGVVILVMAGFLIGGFINKPGTGNVSTLSGSTPVVPAPTISSDFQATPVDVTAKVIKSTPAPTATAVSPYKIEARLVCARADEGYGADNHVDLTYQVTVTGEAIPFATLTLTDEKTQDVFDFAKGGPPGNSTVKNWGGTLHWKVRENYDKEMTFTADGRDYTLKLYKLTTASEAVTQDLQPVAQTTFSKTCEF